MKRIHLGVVLAAALFAMAGPAFAESLGSVFDEANNHFWNGDYAEAAALYERLENLGAHDATLSHNLATTYARLGKPGLAVLHYERALRLDPGSADSRHNLAVLRDYLARRASEAGRDADLQPAAGPWRAVLDRFSEDGAALGFLVLYLGLFAVLVIRRFVVAEMPRLFLGVLAGVLALLTVGTGAVTAGKWDQAAHVKEAVVTVNGRIDVMEGPGSEVRRFQLEEGSRVELLERRDASVHLRDGAGRDGWAAAAGLHEI